MKEITELTSDPRQEHILIGENGEEITVLLEYKDNQIGWFMNLTYEDTTINTIRLVTTVNLLHQWKNIFPFGLSITSVDNGDPYELEDFINERIRVFLLNEEDRDALEEEFYG